MPENSSVNIVSEMDWTLADGILSVKGAIILTGLPSTTTLIDDPNGVGVFVHCVHEKPLARLVFPLGELSGIARLTFAHRYEPFWMTAKVGVRAGDVLPETQFLLCEREDKSVVLFAPILDGDFRASLQGAGENGLELVVSPTIHPFAQAKPQPCSLLTVSALIRSWARRATASWTGCRRDESAARSFCPNL